ncbi:M48 family metallopeptidase [Terrilactibacillus laevilacticus]|uniref:M48 family metallopeptidase n=1 Tax=Terrilactibacillus laevilacticus TaxID=1380157 RepID=A0ABW5PQK8_9BACI|nr:M48 family metallopeptidase [Terrilactibacillus laevilacticus]
MKKIAGWFIGIYLVYVGLMAVYFFLWSNHNIPVSVKGTAADPSIFMTKHQLRQSQIYSQIQNFIYFISIPLDWGIYLFVLIFGLSKWLKKRSESVSRLYVVQMLIYFLTLSLIGWIMVLPIDIGAHMVSIHFGISVQPFSNWFKDQLTSFWVNWLIAFVAMTVVYWFIRKNPKRWWLPVWLLSVPFVIFLMFIQPVVIDPLYNHFGNLQDGRLKSEILQLADRAGIPAHNVYEVDMSKKTNAMNAYVNGIGSNLRIVLWDTTVHRLDHREVLFIMAHEMGHYVMHHLFWGMVGSIIFILIGLYIAAKGLLWVVSRFGYKVGINHPGDIASLPVLLLLFSLLSFVSGPIENTISRHVEHSADRYAVQLTKDPEAGITSFQKLAVSGLDEINPPALVKFMLYDHPTMLERIEYLERMKTKIK